MVRDELYEDYFKKDQALAMLRRDMIHNLYLGIPLLPNTMRVPNRIKQSYDDFFIVPDGLSAIQSANDYPNLVGQVQELLASGDLK